MNAGTLTPRPLHDGWTVRVAPDSVNAGGVDPQLRIPARVPGSVHTDLLAAGLIDDPFLGDNEAAQRWIGQTDWIYETDFSWRSDGAERHDLVFDGLDTVADVSLNDSPVLSSRNQHRSHRVDVSALLREGRNTLRIAFTSPVRWALEQSIRLGARPRPYPLPYEAIRKSASSFGWDWGIHTATSGIWRPVTLESWSTARLDALLVAGEPAGDRGGTVTVDALIERAHTDGGLDDLDVTVEVLGHQVTRTVPAGGDRVRISLTVDDVERWWPVGYGAQPRYEVDVTLRQGGALLHERSRTIGFRTVRWHTEPDDLGTPFALYVNDEKVIVKGVNWIPDDALVTRVTADDYRHRLEQARDAHVNLVRVWGGGIYESDDFFDACDDLGLLTWQDFLFACAAYPEEEPLRTEVAAEAREQIIRLSSHPSLVLLCGNNENLMGYDDWGWQRSLDGATWGAEYYFSLLPELVAELAPGTPYIPGSPFSPHGQRANDERHGPVHLWEQWNRDDWRTYRRHEPRFVAEFGWQGPPTWTTLTRAVHDRPLTPESPGMLVHQKAENGNAKLRDGLLAHAPVPREIADWHWAMQWNQAAAIRFALEHFRALPGNAGTILWQLNDCWPVTSWSAIDSDGRRKPLWYAMRQAYAPRALVVDIEARRGTVLNDEPTAWSTSLRMQRLDFSGRELAEERLSLTVPPRSLASFPLPPSIGDPDDARRELVVLSADAERTQGYFVEPRDSLLEAAKLDIRLEPTAEGTLVHVTAENLVRDLTLLVDRAHPDAVAAAALITLLPGETTQIPVSHPQGTASLSDPLVVRSLNDLVSPRG